MRESPGEREIRLYLEQRAARLSDEVRRYPTPIARCDEQLTGLLEARSEALDLLDRRGAALIEAFAAASARWGDAEALALRERAAKPSRSSV
jgi:hypothetical protein